MAPEKDKNALTDKEMHVLALAWRCFKTQPEVDYEKLAGLAGYANPRSVTNLLGGVKKKINASLAAQNGDSEEGPSTPAKATPKARKGTATPASRKRKVKGEEADDDATSPTPKRARAKKAAVAPVADADAKPDANAATDVSEDTSKDVAEAIVKEEPLQEDDGEGEDDDGIIE
ncbi:hypothetical protein F5B20DRAFT_566651 [Whalleya microplaca]|nr:hypothetical protein F5B20DRAFT_566651 [Whalleya microplaca]